MPRSARSMPPSPESSRGNGFLGRDVPVIDDTVRIDVAGTRFAVGAPIRVGVRDVASIVNASDFAPGRRDERVLSGSRG